MFPDRLDTNRLILRPAVITDAPALFASYASDAEVARFTTWRPHSSPADTGRFLAGCNHTPSARTYALTFRETGAPIGVFDLRRPIPSRIEVGYALGRRFWGQGLMTDALRAVVDWAFAQPEIWRVGAFVDVDNRASARVMEKAGLQLEGLLRRWLVHPNLDAAPRDCFSYAIVRMSD